jgi:hypothetical protein
MSPSLAAHWSELVTVALLGSDRREPPDPPVGGIADLAADVPRPTPSGRLLQQVAAVTAVRRAGVVPGPSLAEVAPPEGDDPRPLTPPSATATWQRIVSDWPLLEDEWMVAVIERGRRLAPELIAPVLVRHRTDALRHARAMVAAGPLGQWLAEWAPRLRATTRARVDAEVLVELPALAVTPEFAPLLAVTMADGARSIADVLVQGLEAGEWGPPDRAVLVNFCARLHPSVLPVVGDALGTVDPSAPGIGLAFALADLVQLRRTFLTELEPS